ncbi:hypothetical protein HY230_11845 [Candidatus Acetothermia bacterium]|nr:hypothetical protein [Candidatus Acetothermia bacterium]
MQNDSFGFLKYKDSIKFYGGEVLPAPDYQKAESWIDKYIHQDGFVYPSMSWVVNERTGEKISKTERPALLYKLPASHELRLSTPGTTEELRKGSGAFIIHLLAYLFETRLQFHDWWFDGRIPIQSREFNFISFPKNKREVIEDFLSHSYKVWQTWPPEDQELITNLLYMHSRVPAYEWDWEQFTIEYMVFDGCFRLAANLSLICDDCGYSYRIKKLCDRFGIPLDNALAKKISKTLRNDLFHETLWDKLQPCTAVSEEALAQVGNLRRLNQRLFPAIFGYETPNIKTPWWSLSKFPFEKPK